MEKKFKSLIALLLPILFMAACEKRPDIDTKKIDQILEEAKAADADTLLEKQYKSAVDALQALTAEMKAQDQKSAISRKYKKAKELYSLAEQAASKVLSEARKKVKISGRIVDIKGKPIADQTISFHQVESKDGVLSILIRFKGKDSTVFYFSAKTDANGKFAISVNCSFINEENKYSLFAGNRILRVGDIPLFLTFTDEAHKQALTSGGEVDLGVIKSDL